MLKRAIKYKIVSLFFILSVITIGTSITWVYVALNGISQPLILHFTADAGITQRGTPWSLASAAVLGFIIIIADYIIALELEEKDKFLGKFIAISGFAASLLLFIGFKAIIAVN